MATRCGYPRFQTISKAWAQREGEARRVSSSRMSISRRKPISSGKTSKGGCGARQHNSSGSMYLLSLSGKIGVSIVNVVEQKLAEARSVALQVCQIRDAVFVSVHRRLTSLCQKIRLHPPPSSLTMVQSSVSADGIHSPVTRSVHPPTFLERRPETREPACGLARFGHCQVRSNIGLPLIC